VRKRRAGAGAEAAAVDGDRTVAEIDDVAGNRGDQLDQRRRVGEARAGFQVSARGAESRHVVRRTDDQRVSRSRGAVDRPQFVEANGHARRAVVHPGMAQGHRADRSDGGHEREQAGRAVEAGARTVHR